MADFTATFEAGVNGATITTAGGEASATAWGSVTLTPTYTNVNVAHGSLAALMNANGELLTWTTLSTSNHYGRFYIYQTQTAAGANRPFVQMRVTGQPVAVFMGADDNDRYSVLDTVAGGHSMFTTNGTVKLNQWIRIEYHIVCSDTVGQVETNYYVGDGATAFASLSSPTTWDTDTVTNEISYGPTFGLGNFYMDDIVANATSFPGPAVTATSTLFYVKA